ncbi:MAG: hypothetical protein AABY15_07890 [Nanoarchaeota archaeon]
MEYEKKQDIHEEVSEVRVAIDTYDDIFSDFDPRPDSVRGFSQDFLVEAERAVMSKNSERINFVIMIEKEKRNLGEETTINNRLKKYFSKYYEIMKKKKKKVIKKGIFFTVAGIILMFAATFLLFKFRQESILTSFFVILLEPGGWFLFWKGLELVLFEAKDATPDLKFYERMVNSSIRFDSA